MKRVNRAAHLRALLSRARVEVEGFGREPLALADSRAIKAAAGFSVRLDRALVSVAVLAPAVGDKRRIFIRAGVPLAAKRAVELLYAARLLTRGRCDQVTALAFAMRGVATARSSDLGAGRGTGVLHQLRGYSADRPILTSILYEIRRSLQGLFSPAELERSTELALRSLASEGCITPAGLLELYKHARLLRTAGHYEPAVEAFRDIGVIAEQLGERAMVVIALAGRGRTLQFMGRYQEAERDFRRSLARARRWGVSDEIPLCLHDLFSLFVDQGDCRRAREFASLAFRAYGEKNPALKRLAHDFADFLNREGRFATALAIAVETVKYAATPGEGLSGWATVARAAAGAGDGGAYRTAARRASRCLWNTNADELTASALLDLARAAAMVGDYERAGHWGETAHRLAGARGEAHWLASAEAFLASARNEAIALDAHGHQQERRLVAGVIEALRMQRAPA